MIFSERSAIAVVSLLAGVLLFEGCATKVYGRQSALTDAEKSNMTCREIALEIAKTYDFTNRVNKASQASAGDVVALMVDTGIGNDIERNAALESAAQRLAQLKELSIARKCGAPVSMGTKNP